MRTPEVEAVQLLWSTWDDVWALLGDAMPEAHGVWLHPTDDTIYVTDWRDTGDWTHEARIGCVISTPEGTMLARQGDWIIKDGEGRFWTYPDEAFRATYEDAG
jgi:hypothetical protein